MKPFALFRSLIGTTLSLFSAHLSHSAVFNIANGDVTGLKNAITTANANGQDDVIELATNGIYTLTTRDNGINGLPRIGADGGRHLTLHGNGATIGRSSVGGTMKFRLLYISSGASVTLGGLTLSNGDITALGSSYGGGIYSDGESGSVTLTVSNCTFTMNSADYGGALYNDGETVSATLSVINSTFTRNSANYGGALFNDGAFGSATLSVAGSTFNENSAGLDSGALQHDAYTGSATGTVINSTFSQNSAGRNGGGIYIDGESGSATLNLVNCTLSQNTSVSRGDGIYNTTGSGGIAVLNIGNTILDVGACCENIFNNNGTITSFGYNLSSDEAGGNLTTGPDGFLNHPRDKRNTAPLLDPAGLKNNGGPTWTIALQAVSPALDQGRRNTISVTDVDQRGESRPFNDPGVPNAIGGDGSDIGAYEASVRITAEDRIVNDLRLSFTSILGHSYEVQSRPNPTPGMWTSILGTTTVGTGGIVQVIIVNAFNQSQQFYRVRQLP